MPEFAHTTEWGRGHEVHALKEGTPERTLCGRVAKYPWDPEDAPKFYLCRKCELILDRIEHDRAVIEGDGYKPLVVRPRRRP